MSAQVFNNPIRKAPAKAKHKHEMNEKELEGLKKSQRRRDIEENMKAKSQNEDLAGLGW